MPLRASITATFTDNSDDQTRVALAQDESPDLTHVRLVKAGDTLPGLCMEIYGDPLRYLQVAEANALDDFRRLEAGHAARVPATGTIAIPDAHAADSPRPIGSSPSKWTARRCRASISCSP